jgi:hypothetical protein
MLQIDYSVRLYGGAYVPLWVGVSVQYANKLGETL